MGVQGRLPFCPSAPPATTCNRVAEMKGPKDQKLQPASLEEAKLLASLAKFAQHEVHRNESNVRKREDIDEILVCHEELRGESPKRPRIATFLSSEGSPFKPYRQCKTSISSKPRPISLEPQRYDRGRKARYWGHFADCGDSRFSVYPPPFQQAGSICRPFPIPDYRPKLGFVPYARHPTSHRSNPIVTSLPLPDYSLPRPTSVVTPGVGYFRDSCTPTSIQRPNKIPHHGIARPVVILHKKFSWKNCPELEAFLIENRDEYLRHSALNYTVQQKSFNNRLTERLLEIADDQGYVFDKDVFSFTTVRDRVRCYYKSYVQSTRKKERKGETLSTP